MNLLILTNNPERASFRQRIGMYFDALGCGGIECDVAVLPRGFFARRKLLRQAAEYDGVFVHKKMFNWLEARTLRKHAQKIIFNFDDAILYTEKHPEKNRLARRIGFQRMVRMADTVIVGSSYLAKLAAPFNKTVKVIPIGLDVKSYITRDVSSADGKIRLVWIGSAATLRYLKQISPVFEKLGSKYKNVVLRIIGDDFFDLQNMPVEEIVWSPQTRFVGLTESDIGLAPLPDDRFSQGKCSFKVLEYMACGLPVVGSAVGTNPDHIVGDITGFLVKDTNEWFAALCRLVENAELCQTMGKAGCEHAKKFDVSIIGQKLVTVIAKSLQ
jgi:glycosyltransferase involved in cell wall biosynthesis